MKPCLRLWCPLSLTCVSVSTVGNMCVTGTTVWEPGDTISDLSKQISLLFGVIQKEEIRTFSVRSTKTLSSVML